MEINISCVQYYNVQVQTGDVDASENDLETYGGGGGGGVLLAMLCLSREMFSPK